MKKTLRKSLIAALLALALLGLTACGSAAPAASTEAPKDQLTRILEKGEIVIAMEGNWAPWGYHDDSDALVGYDADVGRAIAEKLGVKATFVEGEWDGLLAGLDAGRYDLVINGVDVTEDRKESYDFSDAYAYIHTALVVRADNEEIRSFEDLKGQTVYAPAQNPTFIFQYLCEQNGLIVGEDVTIDNAYAQPADLRTAVAAGEVSVAVLPEPMLTMARSGNENLVTAMDLTAEWDKVAPEGSLVQGCVVVRAEFAAEHPNEVAKFLEEYGASIEFLSGDAETVGAVIEESGVFAKGAVAAKALPNCNVCFITGEEMKAAMADFLQIMYETAPASIGGEIPGDDFYYIG